jgi:3-oxoacyl-[acyl-carrier protein] reductase
MTDRGDVALVTGASGALGAAVADVLDARGYRVALHYSSGEQRAKDVSARLRGASMIVQADVGDWESVSAMAERVQSELGTISVLVTCAAVRRDGLMATQSVHEWAQTIQVNLLGTFYACRAVLPKMLSQRWGRIITVVSPAGIIGSSGQTAYSASKAAVIGMTRSLALECGRRNVTVNALSPGFMSTALTDGLPEQARQRLLERSAIRGAVPPAQVALAVDLLLEAGHMTGQVLSIDGGMCVS